MAFSDASKQQIAIKKLVGKAHTRNDTDFSNEPKSSGVTVSADNVFGQTITGSPSSSALYVNNGIYELVRLKAVAANESTNVDTGRLHAFYLTLPSDYESNSTHENAGSGYFVNNQALFESLGKLQLIPPSFGTGYEAKLFYGTVSDTSQGSGTRIFVTDARNWYVDYFNGVIFQENPPTNASEDPLWVEAYVYIGDMASVSHAPSLSSLWEPDPADSNNLMPTNVLDGDTGCFALDMNIYLLEDNTIALSSYTTTTRDDAVDKYFEIDSNGNVVPK